MILGGGQATNRKGTHADKHGSKKRRSTTNQAAPPEKRLLAKLEEATERMSFQPIAHNFHPHLEETNDHPSR
jgi:2'-5' RNA ligase